MNVKKMSTDKTVDNAVFFLSLWGTHLYELYRYVPPQWVVFLLLLNFWGCASIPWVIAGTRICKLVTCSLIVDGIGSRLGRIRECEDLLFPKKHMLVEVWCDKILMRMCIVRCSDSEFSLWQIFYSTVRGLTKFKTHRSLWEEYDG